MEHTLIYFDKPNSNGRIYTRSNIEPLLPKLNERVVYGHIGYPEQSEIKLSEHPSHVVGNFRIDDTGLHADVAPIPDQYGAELLKIIDQVVFRPRSLGKMLPGGLVHVSQILSFDAIPKDEDSWKDSL